jgi:hypothetical protein
MRRLLLKMPAALSFVFLGVFLSCCYFVLWIKIYPEDVDPKNIEYVLWANGLNPNMNLDHALDAMTHDRFPERLVYGLSKQQLRDRFGYILPPDEDWRGCYAWGNPASLGGGKDTVSLRDSRWMVLLDHDKAVDLRICKG